MEYYQMNCCVGRCGLLVIGLFLIVFGLDGVAPQIQAATASHNIQVFCYHRVVATPASEYDLTPAQLEAHFQYFKTYGYHPITIAQLLAYRKKPALCPIKPVALTFDDGTKSHYTTVLPLLKKYGFKATFYIFPNSTRGSKKRWLSWQELAKIARAGMDIGSHALSHPYLTVRGEMDEQQYAVWLEKELVESKKMLEEHLKIKVTTLAYPFGLYDRQVETAALKAGYAGMLSINPGPNRLKDRPFHLKRRIIVNGMGPKSLTHILTERVLEVNRTVPSDGDSVTVIPRIRFRVKTPGVTTVRLEVSKYQTILKPDAAGIYTFTIPGKLKPRFYTIIIRAKDAANQAYINSWSFYYRPGQLGDKRRHSK
jgi:peptidoglycan/xylan/chitin deacetylase (PgdA/CDA1 family)